jgi:hypothetical protein
MLFTVPAGFKNPYKKKKTQVYSRIAFCKTKNVGKNQTKLKSQKTRVYAQKTSTKNAIQEFHLLRKQINLSSPATWTGSDVVFTCE